MAAQQEFRDALEAGDIDLVRRASAVLFPHLPQPKTRAEAEKTMHLARTAMEDITIRARGYSHRWLEERRLPSMLPDRLKPSVDRLYPREVEGVGISVNFKSPALRPAGVLIRGAMERAVEDAYANGDTAPALVTKRMAEARADETKRLFGGLG